MQNHAPNLTLYKVPLQNVNILQWKVKIKMQIISCSTLNAVIISSMRKKYLFVFLYVGDSNITNCISRSYAYIPRTTTSLFLNLWSWAAHDICNGNKKNTLENTLLNTHTNFTRRAGEETLCNKKSGSEILVFFKFKWYWHYGQTLQSLPFSKQTIKTFLSTLQWSSYKFHLTFSTNNDGRFNYYSQMSTGFVIIMAHSCQYKLM